MFERRRIPQWYHHRLLSSVNELPLSKFIFFHVHLLCIQVSLLRKVLRRGSSTHLSVQLILLHSTDTQRQRWYFQYFVSLPPCFERTLNPRCYSRAAERRYSRVKRWLRDVDIFSKDFLIVPINQTAHWYIVLIQYHNDVQTEGDLISDDEDVHGKTDDDSTRVLDLRL